MQPTDRREDDAERARRIAVDMAVQTARAVEFYLDMRERSAGDAIEAPDADELMLRVSDMNKMLIGAAGEPCRCCGGSGRADRTDASDASVLGV